MANIINSLSTYLRGAQEEIKKVTWPTRHQTKNYTLLVFGLSIGVIVFFFVLDYVFKQGLTFLAQFK